VGRLDAGLRASSRRERKPTRDGHLRQAISHVIQMATEHSQLVCSRSGGGSSDPARPEGSRTGRRGPNRPSGNLGAARWCKAVRSHPRGGAQLR
jgi:hypothetical protein